MKCLHAILLVFTIFLFSGHQEVYAQKNTAQPPASIFTATPKATSAVLLKQGNALIHLWGTEEVESASPTFKLKARTTLENTISGKAIKCEVKSKDSRKVFAQCVNDDNLDLGLYMIQKGLATVDRSVIYGTPYENIYIKEERQAQNRNVGIWSNVFENAGKNTSDSYDNKFMGTLSLAVFLSVLIAFIFLSIVIMRGFHKVIKAQNDNMNMMFRERKMRSKERAVVTSMIDSELKANKSKIDAYIVVYEETLSDLKNAHKAPRYQKLGDIVQKQPGLSRAVFDKNADKIDVLGKELASEFIHFYARIKTNPDYETIEPDADLSTVISMVENALENARRLNALAEYLIDTIEEGNFDHTDTDPDTEIEINIAKKSKIKTDNDTQIKIENKH